MREEGILFVLLIFGELVVKGDSQGMVGKLNDFEPLVSELFGIVSHLFSGIKDPTVIKEGSNQNEGDDD